MSGTSAGYRSVRRADGDDDRSVYIFTLESTLQARPARKAPVIAYVLLGISVLAVSSAALVFKKLEEVPPFTLAAWRLQLTTLVMIPPATWQLRSATAELRQDSLNAWWLLMSSGVCLAAHFGSWIWGLQHTSLPHALLFVTCTPLLIAAGHVVLRLPISRGEIISAVVGFLGIVVLCAGAASDKQVTLAGDFLSLCGAVAMVGYLHAGQAVRSWMPIFVYAAPVTATGAALLTLLGLTAERSALLGAGATGIFGYLASPRHFGLVLYLALGPGILGHTGFNALLRYFPPLIISMALTLEPLVGSVMAWAFGLAAVPGPLTWLGGAVLLGALMYLGFCESKRTGQAQKRQAVDKAIRAALEDDGSSMEMANFTIAEDEDEDDEDETHGPTVLDQA